MAYSDVIRRVRKMPNEGISLVKELRHPILKSMLAKDVRLFNIKYEAYVHQIDELNVNRAPSNKLKATSLHHCLEPSLAKALVRLGVFNEHVAANPPGSGSIANVGELNHDIVKVWIADRVIVDEADIASRVGVALAEVSFKVNRADARGAATTFFADVLTKLEEHGCDTVVDNSGKELSRQVLALVEPKSVRAVLEEEWKFWPPADKNDFMKFQRYVTNSVIEAAKWLNGKHARDDSKTEEEAAKSKKRHKGKKSKGQVTGKEDHPGDQVEDANKGGKDESKASSKQEKWKPSCLNPECGGKHRVLKCPTTSREKAKELIAKYKKEKEERSGKVAAIVLKSHDGTFVNAKLDGRWEATLGDNMKVVARGDVGADFSCIPRKLVKDLKTNGDRPKETKLDKPIILEGATTKHKTRAASMIRSDVMLQLNCAPLRLRNIEWLILEDDMSEILLGRPLLKAIGFDVDEHLESNHAVLDGKEFDTDLLSQVNSLSNPNGKLARSSYYKGLISTDADVDPVPEVETAGAAMGEDSAEDIQEAFRVMLTKAKDQGMSKEGLEKAEALLNEFKDVFRIRLGSDGPAIIPPMNVQLKPNARPTKTTQRRYAPAQREFLSETIRKLEKLGAVRANPTSRWASPALAVPKPGSEGFRFTVDLRRANAQVEPMASSMPNLESLFQTVQGSKFFSKIDLCHAYWQIALGEDSQEYFSIQTPLGIFTPERLTQGSTDAGNYFQGMTEPLFAQHADLIARILQWLDDFMLHAATEDELLMALRAFFSVCREHRLKIHALKTEIFATSATFCGRVFDKDGMRYHPSKFEALRSMQTPELAVDLQQFLFALNWMRTSIPDYARISAPLLQLLEECYKNVGGRTKRKLGKLSLIPTWGAEHQQSFDQLRESLENQIKLAFPKPEYDTVLCTDASETHWSGVLTQVRKSERQLPLCEQRHEPLGFVSGSFKKALLAWSTVEKEAFAVVESMIRFEYLIGGKEISLYTDHANLIYIYDPYGRNPGIAKHTASKLTRWAVKLSSFRYVIEAIPGEENYFADLLTRWAVRPRDVAARVSALAVAPVAPALSGEWDWPDLGALRVAQSEAEEPVPAGCKVDTDGIARVGSGAVWIPDSNKVIQLRLLIAAHAGAAGHRGAATTMRAMESFVTWTTMPEDTKSFVASCLHCLSTTTAGTVPRPMAQTLHATEPNKLLHMDYLYIFPGVEGYEYILVLKDDFSSYVRLVKCKSADAENTVQALQDWFATFGVVLHWVSDRGSHFKNEVVAALSEQNKASHRFTLAYAPWSNGTVEVVNREVLRILRALCSELRVAFKEWPSMVPIVQGVLNSASLPRLGNRSPLTAMTGLPADTPLASITASGEEVPRHVDLTRLNCLRRERIEETLEALHRMHREVSEKQTANRKRQIDAHNAKTHVRPCNFSVGDYVLKGVLAGQRDSKLSLRWTGPFRVVQTLSNFVYVLQDLLSGDQEEVHARRIIFFRNSAYEVTEELLGHLKHQEGELHNVANFVGFRTLRGVPQVKVRWQGLEDNEDSWEDIRNIRKDVPLLFKRHLEEISRQGTAKEKRFLRTHRL